MQRAETCQAKLARLNKPAIEQPLEIPDLQDAALNFTWTYAQPDSFSPLDLLPALKFAAALESGALVIV